MARCACARSTIRCSRSPDARPRRSVEPLASNRPSWPARHRGADGPSGRRHPHRPQFGPGRNCSNMTAAGPKGVILGKQGSLTAHVSTLRRLRDWASRCSAGCAPSARRSATATRCCSTAARASPSSGPPRRSPTGSTASWLMSHKCRAEFAALRDLPPVTKDGVRITVNGQCRASRRTAQALDLLGADGIGLFRTEFQFLVSAPCRARRPTEALTRRVLHGAEQARRVRTVDAAATRP